MSVMARGVTIGSGAAAAVAFLAGVAAATALGALTAPGPTVERIRPFIAPAAQAAASCLPQINTLEDADERR